MNTFEEARAIESAKTLLIGVLAGQAGYGVSIFQGQSQGDHPAPTYLVVDFNHYQIALPIDVNAEARFHEMKGEAQPAPSRDMEPNSHLAENIERAASAQRWHGYNMKAVLVKVNNLVAKYAEGTSPWLRDNESVEDKVARALDHAKDTEVQLVTALKSFRDDVIAWMRAFAMTIKMATNGGTHHIKEVRAEGCLELVEGVIQDLRDSEIVFRDHWRYTYPNIFRSDKHTDYWRDRAKNLERQLEELKPRPQQPEPAQEPPF